MAERRVDVVLSAKDEATTALRGFARQIEGLKSPLAALGAVAAAVGLTSLGSSLVRGILAAAQAAGEAQASTAKLAQGIASTGENVSEAVSRFSRFAIQLQSQTGIDDDLIKSQAAVLASIGRLRGEGLERATRAAIDLGAVTGNQDQAFTALAKAAQGNTVVLSKLGIKVDETVPPHQRFDAVLKLIEGRLGGSAAAAVDTYIGRLGAFQTATGNLTEAIGGPFQEVFETALRTVLTPTVEQMTKGVTESDAFRIGILELSKGVAASLLPFAELVDLMTRGAGSGFGQFVARQRTDILLFVAAMEAIGGRIKGLREGFEALDEDKRDALGRFTPGVAEELEKTSSAVSGLADKVRGYIASADELIKNGPRTAATVKSLGDSGEESGKQFLGLNEALKALKLPEFKGDAADRVKAIASALTELDKIRPTIHTEDALRHLEELRKQILKIRDESTEFEIAAKVSGISTLTDLHGKVEGIEKAIRSVNDQEFLGPNRTDEAIAQTERIKQAIDDNIVAALNQLPTLTFKGIEGPQFAKLQIRATLEDLASKPLEELRTLGGLTGATLAKALDLRDSQGGFDAVLDAEIAKLFELADAALGLQNAFKLSDVTNVGFGILLPDMSKIQSAFDEIADIESQYQHSRIDLGIATSEQILAVQIQEIDDRAAMDAEEAARTIGDKQALSDALVKIHETAENRKTKVSQDSAKAQRAAAISASAGIAGALAALFGRYKAFAYAAAIIDAYGAANKALNDPTVLNYYVRLANAISAVIFGLANVRAIHAAKFAEGGIVAGGIAPGQDTGRDTVPALVRGGELMVPPEVALAVVANARAVGIGAVTGPGGKGLTREFVQFLTADRGPGALAFATGGFVTGGREAQNLDRRFISAQLADSVLGSQSQPVNLISPNTVEKIVAATVAFDGPIKVEIEPKGDVYKALFDGANVRATRGSLRIVATDLVTSRSGR